ncbi:MAG TPA: hypothetical protein DDW87_08620 [Firmicutes bacterium]|nr:hypothetical protein [Bacillota bacterium]
MQAIFDESLAFSFQKVVEQSVMEIFNGNGMTGFQESLRNGMNSIACTLQKRVVEGIDEELGHDASLRKGWVIVRRDTKTMTSPFGPVTPVPCTRLST